MRQDSPGSRRDAPCRCGHDRDTHAHLRRGSNCGSCNCPKWRYCPAHLAGTSKYGIAGQLARCIPRPSRWRQWRAYRRVYVTAMRQQESWGYRMDNDDYAALKAQARRAVYSTATSDPSRLAVVGNQHADHR